MLCINNTVEEIILVVLDYIDLIFKNDREIDNLSVKSYEIEEEYNKSMIIIVDEIFKSAND